MIAWRGPATGLVLLFGCAPRVQSAPVEPLYTGLLVDPGVTEDFLDRQRILATYAGRTMSFDAVLQKRGNELTLLGLTPFGSRAFVVIQKGAAVSFQAFVSQSLPFPPRYMLIDVQRVFFPASAFKGAGLREGGRQAVAGGEIVTEQWHEGRLMKRTFSRVDGRPPGEISVDYEGGMADAAPPARVVFTNGWYGYRLEITTVSHQPVRDE